MKIFLIGLPGSGKTTLGKQLAEKLNLSFVDLDGAIERQEGQTISEIFEKKKENYFRDLESAILKRYCSSEDQFVMATGGGTPCFHNNIELMSQSGKTIFLDLPAKEIAYRLSKTNLSERPLFAKMNDEGLKDKIEFLRSQRITFYRRAQLVFQEPIISVEEIMLKIKGYSPR
jgi:shikimate kinase